MRLTRMVVWLMIGILMTILEVDSYDEDWFLGLDNDDSDDSIDDKD